MGEVERRRGYGWNRVLIESERILDPEFADALVYLSGAQIEMLRNVTQYLNRLGTYAVEYNPGYYLVPTDEDFDDILEIVADLEETLMGNPNTIWGYKEQWKEWESRAMGGAGTFSGFTDEVPAGEVNVLAHVSLTNNTGARGAATIRFYDGVRYLELVRSAGLAIGELLIFSGKIVLMEGDQLQWSMEDCLAGDALKAFVMGYKMAVPE